MKTILMIFLLAFTFSVVSSASDITSVAKNGTENTTMINAGSAKAKTPKGKKATHKKHKKNSGTKKAK